MAKMKQTPYEVLISEFGGVRSLARAIDRNPGAVNKWRKRDGTIPSSIQRKVLETAWDRGIRITAHEIIFGRDEN